MKQPTTEPILERTKEYSKHGSEVLHDQTPGLRSGFRESIIIQQGQDEVLLGDGEDDMASPLFQRNSMQDSQEKKSVPESHNLAHLEQV